MTKRRTKRTNERQRIQKIEWSAPRGDVIDLDGVPVVCKNGARLPLVKKWWRRYKGTKPAKDLLGVYVFHWNLKLLFPKVMGVFAIYPSSLVGLDREGYYMSGPYRALAASVRNRDGNRCVLCNDPSELHVHHRTYENWGNECAEELVTLCQKCHSLFHRSSEVLESDLLYAWLKPTAQGKALIAGTTDSLSFAVRERKKLWGK